MTLTSDALDLLDVIGPRPDWIARASCAGVDPELFFPGRGEMIRPAKLVCAGCPVREPCLAYALANGEKFGVWGGTSERERRIIRQRMGLNRPRRAW